MIFGQQRVQLATQPYDYLFCLKLLTEKSDLFGGKLSMLILSFQFVELSDTR